MRPSSILTTVAVAAMLVVAVDYASLAATGDSLVLGKSNEANKTSVVKRTTAGPAMAFNTRPGSPPFAVNQDEKVANLNADAVDGLGGPDLTTRLSAIDPAECRSLEVVTTEYQKVGDLGTFDKSKGRSMIGLEYATTFDIGTLDDGATAVAFEMRVDNEPTSLGSAILLLKQGGPDTPGTITGYFPGLSAGEHTVSIWAKTFNGPGTEAFVDPGCYPDVNAIYVSEFR